MAETWKKGYGEPENGDSPGDDPLFGRKARQWFARCVKKKMQESMAGENDKCLDDEEYDTDRIVEWFVERAVDFVEWQNVEKYHGKGFTRGAWVIDWDKVIAAVSHANAEVNPIVSLDEWLRRDIDNTLGASATEGGADRLPKKLRRGLAKSALARRMRRPLVCVACHGEFPRRRGLPKLCPDCNPKVKAGL